MTHTNTHRPVDEQLNMFAYRVTTPDPDRRIVAQFVGDEDDMAAAQAWCRRQSRRGGVALWLWAPVTSGAALLAEWPSRPIVEHRRESELNRVNGTAAAPACRAMRRPRRVDMCPTTQKPHAWQSNGTDHACPDCHALGYRRVNRIVTARCGKRRRVGDGERRCGAVAVASRVRGGDGTGRVWVCEAHRGDAGG